MDERAEQETVKERLRKQIASVFGWVKKQVQSNPLPSLLAAVLLLLLAWVTWETHKLGNLGFGDKTFWDWMELLLIPIVLAIGAWWLNKSEREEDREIAQESREQDREIAQQNREQDREIAREKRNQDTLETYLDRMTELLLEKNLRESQEGDEVRSIARTRTLAVLRSLDKERKGHVVQFLYESGLIDLEQPVVELRDANLGRANLFKVNLTEANLTGANLDGARLIGANLTRANLAGATLIGASLIRADLSGSDLSKAELFSANLGRANLFSADLTGAYLNQANLDSANLTGAKVTDEQLARADSLEGATMPDGTKHK